MGTRGSDLALRQAEWVARHLGEADPGLRFETVVINTHGDDPSREAADQNWPLGGFVGVIEHALIDGRIDLAVHSHKDLPTDSTEGLVVAAVPKREVPHDVLVTRAPVDWHELPAGFRIGTGSPRRAAQFRRHGDVAIVPIRGNVPTRVTKLEGDEVDGVVLAAAGLARLSLSVPFRIDLPVDEFVPAPGQGALAVQVRSDDELGERVRLIDDGASRVAVTAERAFLAHLGGGCHIPAGALAAVAHGRIELRAQLLTPDGARCASAIEEGADPAALGRLLAQRLRGELG